MSYKISGLPSARAYKEETADFWEIQAIRNPGQFISQTHISRIISKELDQIGHEGIESEDDLLDDRLEDVFIELQRRIQFTFEKYPFSFQRYSMKLYSESSLSKNIYLFLLLCTRFNMRDQKVQNGIDGTLLFEKICAVVARNYFGSSSKSYVFGTAEPGNFESKVKDLITNIGEGQSFVNPNNNSPTKNDDSLDIVVWRDFSDKRMGKLIGFGQCKTGTSWHDEILKLKPANFCNSWLLRQPVFSPLPLVFICDTLNEDFNFYTIQQGFLLFNRFRIIEYIGTDLDKAIQTELDAWLSGAFVVLEIKN